MADINIIEVTEEIIKAHPELSFLLKADSHLGPVILGDRIPLC